MRSIHTLFSNGISFGSKQLQRPPSLWGQRTYHNYYIMHKIEGSRASPSHSIRFGGNFNVAPVSYPTSDIPRFLTSSDRYVLTNPTAWHQAYGFSLIDARCFDGKTTTLRLSWRVGELHIYLFFTVGSSGNSFMAQHSPHIYIYILLTTVSTSLVPFHVS